MTSEVDIKISLTMQKLAEQIIQTLKHETGEDLAFSLIVYNHDDHSRLSYVSNIDRKSVKEIWLDIFDSWDEGMPDIPAHEIQ